MKSIPLIQFRLSIKKTSFELKSLSDLLNIDVDNVDFKILTLKRRTFWRLALVCNECKYVQKISAGFGFCNTTRLKTGKSALINFY